ncbi:MAG: YARHG domain-containing protein [Eggerthellaceae bacterium]|nr:YARHG domain-containing protein [Eggerthellaceae bacterium]
MQCSNCEAHIDEGLLFCPSCGALVKRGGSGTETAQQPDVQPKTDPVSDSQPETVSQPIPGADTRPDPPARPSDQPIAGEPAPNQPVNETAGMPQDATGPASMRTQQATARETGQQAATGKNPAGEFEIMPPPSNEGDSRKGTQLPSVPPKVIIIAAAALVVIIVILIIVLGGVGRSTGGSSAPQTAYSTTRSATSTSTSAKNASGTESAAYLAVKDGRVAIYESDSATPLTITDVQVSDLDSSLAAEVDSKPSFPSIAEAEKRVSEYEDAIKARKEAGATGQSKSGAQPSTRSTTQSSSTATAQSTSSADGSVSISVVGADGATRTATIRRQGSTERVLPEGSTRRLTESDIAGLTDAEKCIAWNEIIAASNGYAFKNSGLASYFDRCSWYHRNPNASGSGDLNSDQAANVELLKSRTDGWWLRLATN